MKNRWFSGLFNRGAGREEAGAVSVERALEIFDYLADRPEITFNYPFEACYERAHMMCRIMMDMGITPKKAWAFAPDEKSLLRVKTPDGKNLEWKRHVAAVLPVRMKDKTIQEMVLDPSLFDGPVPLKVWADIMNAPSDPKYLEIVPVNVAPYSGCAGDYATYTLTKEADLDAQRTMMHYREHQGSSPRVVFASELRQQSRLPLQGTTWMSVSALKSFSKTPSPIAQ